jgi:hypothetical protein
MKFVITEDEKKEIKKLYEQKSSEVIDLGNGFSLEIKKVADPKKVFGKRYKIWWRVPEDYVPKYGELKGGFILPTNYKIKGDVDEDMYGFENLDRVKEIIDIVSQSQKMKDAIGNYLMKKNQKKVVGSVVDSEFLGNKNPFKDIKFSDAQKSYSKELQEGEMFVEWIKDIKGKILEKINKSLNGKNFKFTNENGTESIVTFGVDKNRAAGIAVENDFSKIKEGQPPFPVISFYAHDSSDISRTRGLGGPGDFRLNFSDGTYETPFGKNLVGRPYEKGLVTNWVKTKINTGTWQDNLLKFLQKNFQDVNNLDDDLFIIQKVLKGNKTDFKP